MATPNQPTSITLSHFSHNHPLQLLRHPQTRSSSCSACHIAATDDVYACTNCNFTLHTDCSQLHPQLPDNSHGHPLALTIPTANSFSCAVCNKPGSNTWIYRCATCQFDVHITCVATLLTPPPQTHGNARVRKRDRIKANARRWAGRVANLAVVVGGGIGLYQNADAVEGFINGDDQGN